MRGIGIIAHGAPERPDPTVMPAVLCERSGSVARITLNRPEVLNAADEAWVADLNACAHRAAAEDSVKVVVAAASAIPVVGPLHFTIYRDVR